MGCFVELIFRISTWCADSAEKESHKVLLMPTKKHILSDGSRYPVSNVNFNLEVLLSNIRRKIIENEPFATEN